MLREIAEMEKSAFPSSHLNLHEKRKSQARMKEMFITGKFHY